MKKFFILLASLSLVGCGGLNYTQEQLTTSPSDEEFAHTTPNPDLSMTIDQTALPEAGEKVLVLDTDEGIIKIRLFPTEAPTLVENYTTLADEGKYDGVPFHRVIENFMIQTGDYENQNGTGGKSYTGTGLADEYSTKIKHIKGAVGAAKSSLPNSIGSQFYICHVATPHLDGGYSVWGQVFEGQDVVDSIATVDTDAMDAPLEEVTIKKAYTEEYQG